MAKKTEKEKKTKNIHEIEISIEGKNWKDAIDKAFAKKQKNAKVDGFRKGKVPKNIYERKYGKDYLIDAADLVAHEAYVKALTDSKLEPIVQPSIDLKDLSEDKVTFIFKIVTKPEVVIKNYKGLDVKPEKVKVSKDEIDHELGHILERFTELVNKDGKIENGDVAIIDFEGFKDGVAFEGGKGENYSLEIGSNTFIPGFEEQLIGMKAGEEKDLDLEFPEDYGAKDLAGAKVVFKVKVNEVKTKQVREFDEEFFEDLAIEGVDSEEKLRDHIKSSISAQKEVENENKYVDTLLETVSKNAEVDIPEEMVNEEIDRLMGRFEQQMKMQGVSLDLYYQFTNSDEAQLRSQMEKEAFNNVLYRLVLDEIMKQEKIEVSEEDAEKEAESLAEKYKMKKEEFLKQFGGIDLVKYDLEIRKTVDLLKELNK